MGAAGPRPRFRAGAEGLGGWRAPRAGLSPTSAPRPAKKGGASGLRSGAVVSGLPAWSGWSAFWGRRSRRGSGGVLCAFVPASTGGRSELEAAVPVAGVPTWEPQVRWGRFALTSPLSSSNLVGTVLDYFRAGGPDSLLFAFLLPASLSMVSLLSSTSPKKGGGEETDQPGSLLSHHLKGFGGREGAPRDFGHFSVSHSVESFLVGGVCFLGGNSICYFPPLYTTHKLSSNTKQPVVVHHSDSKRTCGVEVKIRSLIISSRNSRSFPHLALI